MLTIDLVEYGVWTGRLPDAHLDPLLELAGNRLVVTRRTGGVIEIKATEHVGVLVTPDITVRIRPKVDLDNLFYLLGVGDTDWQIQRAPAPYADIDDDLVAAVVRLFCREVDALTSRGLVHGYVTYVERLSTVRGRIDLGAVMRRPWERSPIPCRFDEFVPDVWVNRVLLAGLSEARRAPELPPSLRGELHLLSQKFEGVAHRPIDVEDIARWQPKRNEHRYRVAITLAEFILHHLTLIDRHGRGRAAAFTIDMNALFEDFIGRELAARLPTDLELTTQYRTHLDQGTRPRMAIRPDLVVHPAGRSREPIYVGDVKYKLTESLGTTSDHYQLLAYASVFNLVEGVLIYCQKPDDSTGGDGADPPVSSIIVRGAGVEHFVYRLDVSGSRADIATRLDSLAAWLIDRIRSRAEVPGAGLGEALGPADALVAATGSVIR